VNYETRWREWQDSIRRDVLRAPPEPLGSLAAERARLSILLDYIDDTDVLASTARALWWQAELSASLARRTPRQ